MLPEIEVEQVNVTVVTIKIVVDIEGKLFELVVEPHNDNRVSCVMDMSEKKIIYEGSDRPADHFALDGVIFLLAKYEQYKTDQL